MTTTQRLKDLLGRATPGTLVLSGCSGRMITTVEPYPGDGFIADVDTLQNASLMVAAVNALPALLAVVEAAEKFGQVVFDGVDFAKYVEAKRELVEALAALNTEQKTNG